MEYNLLQLKKQIDEKRKELDNSIEKSESQDIIYSISVELDNLIAEYMKVEQIFKEKKKKLMDNYKELFDTPFKEEVVSQIKAEVREKFSDISEEELEHFSNNVYVYAIMMAHELDKNKIFAQINHLNNLYFDAMQEDGIVKSKIDERNLDYYKALDKKYLEIVKERIG